MPRETKAAVKAQKKQQKLVKKQQHQQQQLQKTQKETENLNRNQKNALQTTNSNNSNNNKLARTNPSNMNYNNNHMNNNNNNIENNNNNTPINITQKLREYQEQQQLQKQLNNSSPLNGSGGQLKFERSGSFSLKGKLSKLINSITSSKESLNKVEDDAELPFKFTRSRSMILPRRTNRRSLIEPQLEQLSEEDPTSPASPRKNSIDHNGDSSNTPLRPQSLQPTTTSTPLDDGTIPSSPSLHARKSSTPVLTQDPAFDPIANFKKRRSSTLISSFKTTFGLSSEKKKDKLNDKWRASLQSLQAVDNMVSYENMSFIDYDKFNTYEKQLERKLSQISLMEPALNCSHLPNDSSFIADNTSYILVSPGTPSTAAPSPFITPQTVVRRRKTASSLHGSARELAKRRSVSRHSFNVDTDYEHNLDKPRNVYRESLDSRKLELLNEISRNSYILDSDLVDILDLALTSVKVNNKHQRYKRYCSQLSTDRTKAAQDVVDGSVNIQVSGLEM